MAKRRINIVKDCSFCGEAQESIDHFLFRCRIAREIWELSPIRFQPGQFDQEQSLVKIFQVLLSDKNTDSSKDYLFPYIGWRLWKARNDLVFNNKRWTIPTIISQAMMDHRIWKEANNTEMPWHVAHLDKRCLEKSATETIHNQPHSFYCCTDGSWVDAASKAGIGWSLHNAQGKCILEGSSAIEPTGSPLETEAIALREALIQVKRLNYQPVTFCGDSRVLYKYLEQYKRENQKPADITEIQTYLEDILAFTNDYHCFLFINRKDNDIADRLAKTARTVSSPLTIFWEC